MLWEFGNHDNTLQVKGKSRSRSRSRSPQPPPMRVPSPSFPIPQANSNPTAYQYGSTLTATLPYPQASPSSYQPPSPSYRPASPYRSPSPYHATSPSYPPPSPSYPPPSPSYPPSSSYPRAPSPSPYSYNVTHRAIPRAVSVSQLPQHPQNQGPQVIHIYHHSSSSHKHKHGKHKHSHSVQITPSLPSSTGATAGSSMPMPISKSTSYYSSSPSHHHQPSRHHHQSHHSLSQPQPQQLSVSPNHRVHFPSSTAQLINQPSVLHKPARTRVHSQPTLPSAMVRPPASSHGHHHSHTQPQQQLVPVASSGQKWQYSTCSGHKKALCIGINYRGQANELRGCVNDAKHVRDFLIKHGGYKATDIVLLTDDSRDPGSQPTRSNIIDAMRWLVRNAHTNDSLFFHYSGHGGQTPDLDGDEIDGLDEVIYPVDYKTKGHIVDDLMHDLLVKPLPIGCRLTGLFDACHSGTVLDLPYIYSSHGRLKGSQNRIKKESYGDAISWSGCKDGQTSADTFSGGVAVGAMSNAFISSLKQNPNQTYQQLLQSIRHILHPRYKQRPQLGSSHHIDTTLKFVF